MKKRILIVFIALIVTVAIPSSGAAASETEEFQARLLTGGMQYTESVKKIKISIDSYTTPEEVFNLIKIQTEQGYEPFMSAFRALNKGIFFPIGGRGIKIIIHGAHSIATEKGRQILLFAQRGSWDVEMSQRIDHRFPFMVIELNVDAKGKGTGKIYEQASISLTPERTFVMDGYNSPPKQLWDVKLLK
ncbi:MAG: hypothetical protein WAU81_01900 [Candidatus Aminicenantales bacterium]